MTNDERLIKDLRHVNKELSEDNILLRAENDSLQQRNAELEAELAERCIDIYEEGELVLGRDYGSIMDEEY
jgi:regulator of replication initiation timing